MIEITGKYGTAKVLVSDWINLEDAAHKQIINLLNQKWAEGCNIAVMPDVHAGAGCVIGFTQKINGRVCPNLVGVDISCGMQVLKISKDFHFDLKNLDKVWRQKVPMGMEHRKTKHSFCKNVDLSKLIANVNLEKELLALGTLGGGNHFCELNKDENGNYYLVTHSGSRHLGIEVCKYWQNKAITYCNNNTKAREELIQKLKAEGREKEIEAELKKLPVSEKVPNELAYLEGEDLEGYLHDMRICQDFAYWSRKAMQHEICEALNIKRKYILDEFCTVHNYVDTESRIVRKGSIRLLRDELAIIPGSMEFGSLIVKGKGNPEYNFSGPHGFGRKLSRAKAKETLKMEEFKDRMKNVYSTSVCIGTIDESPMAYKAPEDIIPNLVDICDVITHIIPIWNVKAGDED